MDLSQILCNCRDRIYKAGRWCWKRPPLVRARRWCRERPLLGALLVALAAVFLLLWVLALVGVFTVLLRTICGASASIGTGAMIVALLGAPILLWSTYLKTKTLHYQKEGHITERITKAIENLGAEKTVKRNIYGETQETTEPNIEVRLGGLLSLERIAQDSTTHDKGRDHVRVMEILCAYVRENAPASAIESPLRGWPEVFNQCYQKLADTKDAEIERYAKAVYQANEIYKGELEAWLEKQGRPREDIQQALYIIGRRTAEQRRYEARWDLAASIDAEWVFDKPPSERTDWLDRANIDDYSQRMGEAWKRKLEGYRGYRSYRMDLRATNLINAELSGLVLAGAILEDAQMQGANFYKAQMNGATFINAQLQRAFLHKAQMQGADLEGAQMQKAILNKTQMQRAFLYKAKMQNVDLESAQMQEAIIFKTQMQEANLRKAQMQGAILYSTNISECSLEPEQLASMFGDGSVTLSEEQKEHRPAHWPKTKLKDNEFYREYKKWLADLGDYRPPSPKGNEPEA